MRQIHGWLGLSLVFVAGCMQAPSQTPATPTAVDTLATLFEAYTTLGWQPVTMDQASAERWADSTLATLSLDEKIGQLFIVHLLDRDVERLRQDQSVPAVSTHGVGGFLVSRLIDPTDLLDATQALQRQSKLPLFFAADYERGVGRFANTLTELPANMALGATRDTLWGAAAGRLTAIESRAVGVNWLFAPVADVNNNPANPIINIRSYGEDPALVGHMAAAFVHEAEAYGVLTTLKHFPGHGNTSVDSHSRMGTIAGSYASFMVTEVAPFRHVLTQTQPPAAVMTAHLWAQALDEEALPATFSPNVLTHLLRDTLQFNGLIVTDDVRMGALRNTYSREARTLRPLRAGSDVILTPADLAASMGIIKTAVQRKRLTEKRLSQSVRRILVAKARIGLHQQRFTNAQHLEALMSRPLGEPLAERIATQAVTALKTHPSLPLDTTEQIGLVHLTNYEGSESISAAMDTLETALSPLATTHRLDDEPSAVTQARIKDAVHDVDVIVLALYLRLQSGRGKAGLRPQQTALVQDLLALDVPIVLVTFGNPYAVTTFADADAHLVGYDQTMATIKAMADMLTGQAEPQGQLPITVEPYRFGAGLQTLQPTKP